MNYCYEIIKGVFITLILSPSFKSNGDNKLPDVDVILMRLCIISFDTDFGKLPKLTNFETHRLSSLFSKVHFFY